MTEPVSGDVPPPLSVSGSGGIHPSVMLFFFFFASKLLLGGLGGPQ